MYFNLRKEVSHLLRERIWVIRIRCASQIRSIDRQRSKSSIGCMFVSACCKSVKEIFERFWDNFSSLLNGCRRRWNRRTQFEKSLISCVSVPLRNVKTAEMVFLSDSFRFLV